MIKTYNTINAVSRINYDTDVVFTDVETNLLELVYSEMTCGIEVIDDTFHNSPLNDLYINLEWQLKEPKTMSFSECIELDKQLLIKLTNISDYIDVPCPNLDRFLPLSLFLENLTLTFAELGVRRILLNGRFLTK